MNKLTPVTPSNKESNPNTGNENKGKLLSQLLLTIEANNPRKVVEVNYFNYWFSK